MQCNCIRHFQEVERLKKKIFGMVVICAIVGLVCCVKRKMRKVAE